MNHCERLVTTSQAQSRFPRVSIEAQGRLLTVQCRGAQVDDGWFPNRRGAVTGFSEQSRMRLLRLTARLQLPQVDGFRYRVSFMTLTTAACLHPRIIKKRAFVLFRKLKRAAPRMAVIWRMEYQKRGAPHIHCILYNSPWIDRNWLTDTWGEIVGESRPFTRIERVKGYRRLVSYVSKYVGKVQGEAGFNSVTYLNTGDELAEDEKNSAGRVWGVWNRGALPYAELEKAVIPLDGSWFMIKAYARRFFPWIHDDLETGFTLFMDDPYHALAHIQRLQHTFDLAWKRANAV